MPQDIPIPVDGPLSTKSVVDPYGPLRSISAGELLFNAHHYRQKLTQQPASNNKIKDNNNDLGTDTTNSHRDINVVASDNKETKDASNLNVNVNIPTHPLKLSMKLKGKTDGYQLDESFLFSNRMYDFLSTLSSVEHFQQVWTNIEQLTSQCRERKTNLRQRKIATYESSKAMCRSLITQALHGVKGGETFCNDVFMSTTRQIDNELCRCICRLICVNEMEYTLIQQNMAQLRRLEGLLLQKAQLVRDLALFNLHLHYETKGEIGLKRLSPSNAQYQRCKKAATENIKPGYFPEYSFEETHSESSHGRSTNKGGDNENENPKKNKGKSTNKSQMNHDDDFMTKEKCKYSIKVLEVYKIENQPLLREFQASANQFVSGKVKGLFFPVEREALEQVIVNGVTASAESSSNLSFSDLNLEADDDDDQHFETGKRNTNTTNNRDTTKKGKSGGEGTNDKNKDNKSTIFSQSTYADKSNKNHHHHDSSSSSSKNESDVKGSGINFLKDAWFQIPGNFQSQSNPQKLSVPSTTRSYAKTLVQASKAPVFPCFFSRYSTFEQDRRYLLSQLDQDVEANPLNVKANLNDLNVSYPVTSTFTISQQPHQLCSSERVHQSGEQETHTPYDCNDVSKLRYLVLCRVLMGKIYVTNEKLNWHPNKILHKAFNDPKDIEKWKKLLEQAEGCDCIYSSANEEYFVINPNYVLPEFLVVYRLKGMTEEKWAKRIELINNKDIKLKTNTSFIDDDNQNVKDHNKIMNKATERNEKEEQKQLQCNLAITYDDICSDFVKAAISKETAVPTSNFGSSSSLNSDSWHLSYIRNIISPISPYPLQLAKKIESQYEEAQTEGNNRKLTNSSSTLNDHFLLRGQKNNNDDNGADQSNDFDNYSSSVEVDRDNIMRRQTNFLKQQLSLSPLRNLQSIRKHMLAESNRGDFSELLHASASESNGILVENDCRNQNGNRDVLGGVNANDSKEKNTKLITAILEDYEGEVQEELAWQNLVKKKFMLVRKYLRIQAEKIFVEFSQKQKELVKETEQIIISGIRTTPDMTLNFNGDGPLSAESRRKASQFDSHGKENQQSLHEGRQTRNNSISSLGKEDFKIHNVGHGNQKNPHASIPMQFQVNLPQGLLHPVLEQSNSNSYSKGK